MASNSSWVPSEDSQTLFSERCWLQGVILSCIAYGIVVSLYVQSFHLLVRTNNRVYLKKRIPLLIYITVALILDTILTISLMAFTQMAFIDDRNYPGGPNAFENNMFSIPMGDSGNTVFVLSNWLCDSLVVWRFKLIYQRCRAPIWLVMLFPCLMLAGSIGLGIMFLIQVSTTNPFVANGINFTLPYLSLSLTLNIVLTISIVLRLLTVRYRITSLLGPEYGTHYTSIVAMIVESAAVYSTVSIAFLILFGSGNPVSQVFLQSMNQIQIIATLLIVFRVAQGKGWTEETATHMMTSGGPNPVMLDKMPVGVPCDTPMLASREIGATKDIKGEFQCEPFSHSAAMKKDPETDCVRRPGISG